MIKFRSIIIKIIAFVDSFTVVFKTRILCSGTFLCNWYMRYKLRKQLYRQAGGILHYTCYESHGFNVLDNSVYRYILIKRTV